MVLGFLRRPMPSSLKEWENIPTVANPAMQQQLALALGFPSNWRVLRFPHGGDDLIYDVKDKSKDFESAFFQPRGEALKAKFKVGDVVEVVEAAVKPDFDDIMKAHTMREQDLQWYEATVIKKTEYLNDIRYEVHYSIDDTTQTNVRESKMRAITPKHTGRWSKEEHETFLTGMQLYGKEWKKVAARVRTRTAEQTRGHARDYFRKLDEKSSVPHRSPRKTKHATPTKITARPRPHVTPSPSSRQGPGVGDVPRGGNGEGPPTLGSREIYTIVSSIKCANKQTICSEASAVLSNWRVANGTRLPYSVEVEALEKQTELDAKTIKAWFVNAGARIRYAERKERERTHSAAPTKARTVAVKPKPALTAVSRLRACGFNDLADELAAALAR